MNFERSFLFLVDLLNKIEVFSKTKNITFEQYKEMMKKMIQFSKDRFNIILSPCNEDMKNQLVRAVWLLLSKIEYTSQVFKLEDERSYEACFEYITFLSQERNKFIQLFQQYKQTNQFQICFKNSTLNNTNRSKL